MAKKRSFNPYVKKELYKQIKIESKPYEYFLNYIDVEEKEKETIWEAIKQAKQLPAGLREFHGNYPGGLFDHILLVANFTYYICETSLMQIMDTKKAVITAIYHDFGKISYYGMKKKLENRRIFISPREKNIANKKTQSELKLEGVDNHVDECIAILDKYNLPYDEEIHRAIVFHHGSYSIYEPYAPNRLATLINNADMIAVQIYKV